MKILRIRDVIALTGLGRTTIWRLERARKFPNRVQLSEKAVGWRSDEIEKWIRSRTTAKDAA